MKKILKYSFFALCTAIVSCGGDDIVEGTLPSSPGDNNTPPPSNISTHPYTRLIEVPQLKEGNIFVYHAVKVGADSIMNYCLDYDPQKYHSRWVAFRFDNNTDRSEVSRKDYSIRPQYPQDPKLNPAWALEDDALYGSGYDHGHLVASADRLYSREANDQTFYMTNMSPQIGDFNSGLWADFEQEIRLRGRDPKFRDTLYVCKGGTIDRSDHVNKNKVAGGLMVVPKYYFMAAVAVKNGAYKGIAFWLEHKKYSDSYSSPKEMRKFAISIDALEEKTGIDFFHNLPDKVENAIEANYNPNEWIK